MDPLADTAARPRRVRSKLRLVAAVAALVTPVGLDVDAATSNADDTPPAIELQTTLGAADEPEVVDPPAAEAPETAAVPYAAPAAAPPADACPDEQCRKAGRNAAPRPAPSPPPRPAANPRSFAFHAVDAAGRPARWDPCVEIRWALNPEQAPQGALGFVQEGLRRLAEATGLRFRYVGTTTYRPYADPDSAAPSSSDAVIGFGDSRTYPEFRGSTFGLGGITWTRTSGGLKVIGGAVALSTPALARLTPGFGAGRSAGGVLLHELGHMVGLGHVTDVYQAMNVTLVEESPAGYAAGDRTGLAKVGAPAGCFPKDGPPQTTPAPSTTSTTSAPRPPASTTTSTTTRLVPLAEASSTIGAAQRRTSGV